jgi:hypothetical protein
VGQVGLRVYVPTATRDAASVGKIVDLFTHLHIRENEWTLYGFPSQEELELFGYTRRQRRRRAHRTGCAGRSLAGTTALGHCA